MSAHDALITALVAEVGDRAVHIDEASLLEATHDVHLSGACPAVVVTPASAEQVAAIVKVAAAHDYVLIPRGGGLSYTGGYAASTAKSIAPPTAGISPARPVCQFAKSPLAAT